MIWVFGIRRRTSTIHHIGHKWKRWVHEIPLIIIIEMKCQTLQSCDECWFYGEFWFDAECNTNMEGGLLLPSAFRIHRILCQSVIESMYRLSTNYLRDKNTEINVPEMFAKYHDWIGKAQEKYKKCLQSKNVQCTPYINQRSEVFNSFYN